MGILFSTVILDDNNVSNDITTNNTASMDNLIPTFNLNDDSDNKIEGLPERVVLEHFRKIDEDVIDQQPQRLNHGSVFINEDPTGCCLICCFPPHSHGDGHPGGDCNCDCGCCECDCCDCCDGDCDCGDCNCDCGSCDCAF